MMTIKSNLFALLMGGVLLTSAGGCGDSHKIPTGAPKGNSDPVSVDMGAETGAGKEASPPSGETPAEPPPATEAAPPSDSATPPTEKAPEPPAEK